MIEFFDGTCGYMRVTKLCSVGIVYLTRVKALWACSSVLLLRLEVATVLYLDDVAYHFLDVQFSIHLKNGSISTRRFLNDSQTNLKDVAQAVDVPNGLQYRICTLRTLGSMGQQ
jgi:hypothetical protein